MNECLVALNANWIELNFNFNVKSDNKRTARAGSAQPSVGNHSVSRWAAISCWPACLSHVSDAFRIPLAEDKERSIQFEFETFRNFLNLKLVCIWKKRPAAHTYIPLQHPPSLQIDPWWFVQYRRKLTSLPPFQRSCKNKNKTAREIIKIEL